MTRKKGGKFVRVGGTRGHEVFGRSKEETIFRMGTGQARAT